MIGLFRLMPDWLALILVIFVIWWGITFNMRLQERYGCTACTFWGVSGGVAGTFCWMLASGAVGGGMERLIAGGIAALITLALFVSNREKSGSTFPGIMMTVWQLFVGLAAFLILAMLDSGKKNNGK